MTRPLLPNNTPVWVRINGELVADTIAGCKCSQASTRYLMKDNNNPEGFDEAAVRVRLTGPEGAEG